MVSSCDDQENQLPQFHLEASITVSVTMIAFIVCHKLTNKAISDLLYIMDYICPKPNKLCKTLYNFKNFFSFLVTPFNHCYYCPQCLYPFSDLATTACTICKKVFNSVKDLHYFLHVPIHDQIKSLFVRKSFFSNLHYRFARPKFNQDNYEDIYDGQLYKRFMSPNGILNNVNNISLTWNVDGLPIFESSKYSLWPCYFVINELPYRLRLLKENMIIGDCGLGKKNQTSMFFLNPL